MDRMRVARAVAVGRRSRGWATGRRPVQLDAASVPRDFVLEIDTDGVTSAKLVVDGEYASERSGEPVQFALSLAPGEHRVRARAMVDDTEVSVEARFTVEAAASTPPETAAPASAATDTVGGGVTSTVDGEIVVDTVEEIRAALSSAGRGDVIRVADGEYLFDERLVASASGTADAPITLLGTRAAMLRTEDVSDDYGLHVTGDNWRIEGITIAYASKGIVLDGSVGTVIDRVEVYEMGDEAIHFRSCSSDGVLRNSFIHDTGRDSPLTPEC